MQHTQALGVSRGAWLAPCPRHSPPPPLSRASVLLLVPVFAGTMARLTQRWGPSDLGTERPVLLLHLGPEHNHLSRHHIFQARRDWRADWQAFLSLWGPDSKCRKTSHLASASGQLSGVTHREPSFPYDRLVSQLCAFAPLVGELVLECLVTWVGVGGVRSWESNASSLLYDTENIHCVCLVQLHTLANWLTDWTLALAAWPGMFADSFAGVCLECSDHDIWGPTGGPWAPVCSKTALLFRFAFLRHECSFLTSSQGQKFCDQTAFGMNCHFWKRKRWIFVLVFFILGKRINIE